MSDAKHWETIITNEGTIKRRAWIEFAIKSVRARMGFIPEAEFSESSGESGEPPNLYVAYPDRRMPLSDRRAASSDRRRRSGA
jgi:hypothetical protein